MQKMYRTLLFWSILLSACSAIPAAPQTVPPGTTAAVVTAPTDMQNCGYQWAYQDLPELSSNFQQSIQALQPEAQASAYLFGENCILPDGSIGKFLVKETDFRVTLQVEDLSSEEDLGNWIVKVMQVITAIPPDQISGPQPGLVSIFFQTNGDQKAVNFTIDRYQSLPSGLSSAEISRALQQPQ